MAPRKIAALLVLHSRITGSSSQCSRALRQGLKKPDWLVDKLHRDRVQKAHLARKQPMTE